MNYKKTKRFLSLFITLSIILSTCFTNMGCVFATTVTSQMPSYKGARVYLHFDDSLASADVSVEISSSSYTTVSYPSFDEVQSYLGTTDLSGKLYLMPLKSASKYKVVNISSGYYTIPQYFLTDDASVETVNINTTNDITLAALSFSNCSKLKEISISAPNSTVTLSNSAFMNNSALETLTINAKTIKIGSATFSATSPKNISLSGNIETNSVISSLSSIDALTLNSANISNKFLDGCTITNLNCKGTTTLNSSCFSSCKITNLNLEGTTTFNGSDFSNCTITNMSINGKTTFGNSTLNNCKVTNMYFNLDNRNNCGNISYKNAADRLGYKTTVNNMYFNYADINGNKEQVQELNNFPLGDTSDTSLNCDNIYFYDANFKYINGSSYKRMDGKKTTVYAWGGAIAWDADGNRKASYDMYKEWMDNNTCTFYNYVKNTNSGKAEDVFDLKVSEVYIADDKKEATYDFSNPENIYVWATFESQNNQYAEKEDFVKANNYTMKPLTMNTSDNATSFATNFNYRIFKKDSSITSLASDKYNYYYSSTDTNTAGWYTALTTETGTDTLTEGTNYYLLEVGGVKYPFTINAKYNKIEKLTVEPNKEASCYKDGYHLNTNEKLTNDMIVVKATYSNKKEVTLSKDEYEIVEHNIIAGTNTVTVRTKEHVQSDNYVKADVIVNGYEDVCTGFKATCDVTELYEGGNLSVSNITLTDVTYQNPTKTDVSVVSGFAFIVDDKESNTYPIKKDVNNISIKYKGYTLENAVSVKGVENTITKVEAVYTGTVVEGCQIATGTSVLSVYVYENGSNEKKLITDNKNVTLAPYVIEAGKDNLITVYYKGIQASEPMVVKGVSDTAKQIMSIKYSGTAIAGQEPKASDIFVWAVLQSGKMVTTTNNPEIIADIKITEKVFTYGMTTITVEFKGLTNTIPVNVQMPAETPVPDITTSPAIISPTPVVTTTPAIATSTPVVTTTPAVTTGPTITPIVTTAPLITATPVVTTTPAVTASATPTTAPVSATPTPNNTVNTVAPKKGATYTVKNVKYKVASVKKSNKTGTAYITGYKKGSVKVASKVKIKGYTFTVTSISNNAFKNCTTLQGTVTISGSIKKIGNNAFYGCKNIKKVVIGSKVKSLGTKSFYKCTKLKTVDLRKASTLSKIGSSAFKKNAKNRKFQVSKREKTYMNSLLKGKK